MKRQNTTKRVDVLSDFTEIRCNIESTMEHDQNIAIRSRLSSVDDTTSSLNVGGDDMSQRSSNRSKLSTFVGSCRFLCATKSRTFCVTILLLLLCSFLKFCDADHVVGTYKGTNGEDEIFNHLVVHDYTEKVYVGAVNRLYQLSANLNLERQAITGPQDDNYDCPVTRICPPGKSKKPMNNWNKALLIDYSHSKLIACGSLFQGVCAVHELDDISSYTIPQNEAVVANNATASTVAFIAPGPVMQPETHVMYVGVTFTNNGAYRSDVPAVSSRSLAPKKIFKIASTTVTTATRLRVNSLAREHFFITYVYGFSSRGYSFFVTYQRKYTEKSPRYLSKLVRICQNDTHYYSYTEIPLECRAADGSNYNLVQAAYLGKPGSELAVQLNIAAQDEVLYAVFSQSIDEQDIYNKPSDNSALCVYSMKDIQHKFKRNIQSCFQGVGTRGLDFVNPSMDCVLTQIQITDDFCGVDVNTPLGGDIAMGAEPVLTYRGTTLTAVAATSTHLYTVVFLGTSDGHLKKIVVESPTSPALEYSDIIIDEGSKVNSDLAFDPAKQHIYVMTERTVSRVKLQECGVYETCMQCLGARDPYCGWCSLENKCSLLGDCSHMGKGQKGQPTWQSYKSGRCTTITEVRPHQIQRTTARKLDLVIDNLPQLPGQFLCIFNTNGRTLETDANRTPNGVLCPTPQTDRLPKISPGEHHFTATLSVRQGNGPDYVSTNFTFYDCNTYSSCTECVSSPFPCDWCIDGHRCTHDTGENCRSEILITGINNIGPSLRSGPGFCPRINATTDGSVEMLVPAGLSKRIRVKVDSIQQSIIEHIFVCQFNIEGRVTTVPARLMSHVVYCEAMEFTYTSRAPNTTAAFAVIWDGFKPLDNPLSIHVLVYRCRGMADNCGTCLTLEEKYNCGWCQSTKTCEVKDQCSNPDGKFAKWLDRSKTCPEPTIRSFYPTSGPYEGGTNVTILGINLGKRFEDIEHGVIVSDIKCVPYRDLYVRTKKIVCKVGNPKMQPHGPISGAVAVTVLNNYTAVSQYDYQYVNPKIKSIDPNVGPMAGGTKLHIRGSHMNAGSRIKAYLNGSPCKVIRIRKNQTDCITPPSNRIGSATLKMEFDNGVRTFTAYHFKYGTNPTISRVESGAAGSHTPKGIPSGGIIVTVTGKHLDTVQEPKLYIAIDGNDYSDWCDISKSNKNIMKCRSPQLPKGIIKFVSDDPVLVEYGFVMDNVTELRNLSSKVDFKSFQLYPDPIYEPFTESNGIKYYKNDYLTINGKNLDRASQESDVMVRIGTGYCNVTSLSRSQLTCRPPTKQPPAYKNGVPDSDLIPEVEVIVGGNLRYKIGKLSYKSPESGDGRVPQMVMIWVAVGGIILVIIVIIILIAYKRKSSESNRVLKNMQEQMDVLELRVASECKEAFAELQTEMTDLTSDITTAGIPFLDYRTYAMKILFPNIDDHPVLSDFDRPIDPIARNKVDKGLRLFGQLIMNKTFLLLFIRTLESNRYFSMRDRVNVASLIMVTLQGKMEYCSDIQKTLLAELIEKCIDGKSHPKLLLRRTESVAEKMLSAWFTFLLYKFLRECAGEPLFLLYRAIKQQVDKGPVDAVTSEARYSLSEEKLIRQSIDYKPLNVYVSMYPHSMFNPSYDPHTDNMDVPVKVLDCDTISQVKEKSLDTIYKYHPYSQRPCKDDLDLEWRTGTTGRLILSDEDATTRPDNEWKRLNTLAHYKVPDGALLTLVTKQSSMYNQTIHSDKSDKSHKYETLNYSFKTSSPPTSRATSPLNHDMETGYKLWHLVKHHDGDNQKEGERGNKMVSEIYLTRLLATKGTLQKFVDDLFETIFSTAHRGSALPLAIKYMFDFLDDQALQHGITDPEVVHTWKSNSLPLRFWVNLIKNPNFVFDISKSNIVDSCLSVVAQTFMDSCSTSDHRLGKDSPSSKLLYAKDIPIYKEWVERYYQDIKMMPAISDQDMNAMLAEESRMHMNEFNTQCALYELFSYTVKYYDQLMQTLEEDEFSNKNQLAYKLEQVNSIMSGESDA